MNAAQTDQALRSIVVTGASRGIGRAIAVALAKPGHFIWINYASAKDQAEEVLAEVRARGGDGQCLAFDVSSSEAVTQAFSEIEAHLGGVDVLINNSGIARDSLLLRMKDIDIQRTLEVNVMGAMFCSRAAMKTMLRRKSQGRIINVGSVVGLMGNAGQTAYAASKGGLFSLTKALAREVASRGVTVNAVAPGFVDTDMTRALSEDQRQAMLKLVPLGRYAKPEEVASLVQFLASPQSSYITGQIISINGGMYM